MCRTLHFIPFLSLFFLSLNTFAATNIKVFDKILFYDGYAQIVSEPVPAGVIRHRNDLYAKKLTAEQLQSIENTLKINVTIKASCDNYDRIGNVNLAFVPKGDTIYKPDSVNRLEIARFITPFMNKNKQPDTVPYNFEINNILPVLKDQNILSVYDIWVELEVFGVPYAAQTQVAGCAGRIDVFFGSLTFITDNSGQIYDANILLPLAMKQNFNNYQAGATDTIGKTRKTIPFSLSNQVTNAKLTLITSNHGANTGGEEYNRRNHYVYLDGVLKLTYKPGRQTCEPFRVFNTQSNGIYGTSPKTDAQWQSFSNWCPGDIITTRVIDIGPLAAGAHSFMIHVPDAQFVNKEGNIPLSLYLQAKSQNTAIVHIQQALGNIACPVFDGRILTIHSYTKIEKIKIFTVRGQQVLTGNSNRLDLSNLDAGMYLVKAALKGGQDIAMRVVKQ